MDSRDNHEKNNSPQTAGLQNAYDLANKAMNEVNQFISTFDKAALINRYEYNGWHISKSDCYPDSIMLDKDDLATGRSYSIRVDLRNDVNTCTIDGNADDKVRGMLGTNGQTVVKFFGQNAYDYVKVDDFVDRISLLYDTAIELTKNSNIENKNSLTALITSVKQSAIENVLQNYDFYEEGHPVRSKNTERFNECFNNFSQYLTDSANVLQTALTENKVIKNSAQFKKAEISLVTKSGRPLIIKTGDIEGNQYVNAQIPLGTESIPSSDRSGKHKTKLSNHVREVTGTIDKDNNLKISLSIDGHSSYPPIAEKDTLKKRYIAYLAVEERIKQLVTDKVNDPDYKAGSPVNIDLSVMMMLSPLRGDKLLGSESEHNQVADTMHALEMYLSNKPDTVELSGRGSIPLGSVKINYMNNPVNAGLNYQKLAGNILYDKIQKEINNKGIVDFIQNGMQHFIADNNTCAAVNNYITTMNNIFSDPVVIKAKSNIEQASKGDYISGGKQSLQSLYQDVTTVLTEVNQLREKQEKTKNDEVRIKSLTKSHDDLIKIIEKKQEYVANQYQIIIDQINNKAPNINNVIRAIHKEFERTDLSPEQKKSLFGQLHFIRAIDLHQDQNKLGDPRHAYRFHVAYLMANKEQKKTIEAFCKSAEDRTGWLRISMMTEEIFINKHGRPPNFDNEKDCNKYFTTLRKCIELSSSMDNTGYNSNARGLNVADKFTSQTIYDDKSSYSYNMSAGKQMATLAKSPYEGRAMKLAKTGSLSQALGIGKSRSSTSSSSEQSPANSPLLARKSGVQERLARLSRDIKIRRYSAEVRSRSNAFTVKRSSTSAPPRLQSDKGKEEDKRQESPKPGKK